MGHDEIKRIREVIENWVCLIGKKRTEELFSQEMAAGLLCLGNYKFFRKQGKSFA